VHTAVFQGFIAVYSGLENSATLDAFAKLRKAATIFVLSVRPSIGSNETTRFPIDGIL
jgi:hypothetical protein